MTLTRSVGKLGDATSQGVAMPEFLTRNDVDGGSWTVGQGTPTRGDAWTNIHDRHMRVPFGDSPLARVIRAHEMAHAKASPIDGTAAAIACESDVEIVAACEEIRVNEMIKLAGFDIDLLADGSEKATGIELAKMGRDGWNGVVQMVAATANTKASNALISGIRSVDPDMAKAAGELRKAIRKYVARAKKRYNYGEHIGSTVPSGYHEAINRGFLNFTAPLAELVSAFTIETETHEGDPIEGDPNETLEELAKRAAGGVRGQWAKMVIDPLPLTRHIDGKLGRKRIASDVGRNPRRIDRMLTDPERRVFDRRSRGKGGVVLIDQSGSMHLDTDDVNALVEAAPGCVIIGYSHQTHDATGVPNVWVLANRGKVVESVRDGNGGNGVDGPALRFALSHRRTGEPVLWVCDGLVTDGRSDMPYANLEQECAALVDKHGVHMVGDVEEGIEALRRAARGERLPTRRIGRLATARINDIDATGELLL